MTKRHPFIARITKDDGVNTCLEFNADSVAEALGRVQPIIDRFCGHQGYNLRLYGGRWGDSLMHEHSYKP